MPVLVLPGPRVLSWKFVHYSCVNVILGLQQRINVVCQSLYVSSLVRVLQRRHLSQLLRRVEVSLPQASLALSSFWVLVELLPSRSDDSNGNDATNTFRRPFGFHGRNLVAVVFQVGFGEVAHTCKFIAGCIIARVLREETTSGPATCTTAAFQVSFRWQSTDRSQRMSCSLWFWNSGRL